MGRHWDCCQSTGWRLRSCIHTIIQVQALLGYQSCSLILPLLSSSTIAQCFLGMFTPILGLGLPITVRGPGPQSLGATHLLPTVLGGALEAMPRARAAPSSAITHCLLPTRAGMPPTCSGSQRSSSPPWGFWRCLLNSGRSPCWRSQQMGGRWCVTPRPGTSTTARTSGLWGPRATGQDPPPSPLAVTLLGTPSLAMQPNMALSEARSGVTTLPCFPLHFPLPCGVLSPSLGLWGVLPIKGVHRQPGSLTGLRQCCFHVAGSSSARR